MSDRADQQEQRPEMTQLFPELLAELEGLNPAEQALLARVVKRAKYNGDERTEITDVSIVNEFLKVDQELDDFSSFQDTNSKAPPVIKEYPHYEQVPLPTDHTPIKFSISEVISKRVSRRDFSGGPLTLAELSTLLHYSYGVRKRTLAYNIKDFPFRMAPSSGGLQTVEVYLTVNAVEGLKKGLYHYNANKNLMEMLDRGNMRRKVIQCCTYQDWLDAASIVLFLTCDLDKLYWKYGRRSYRMAHIDVGIVAENLHLVATGLRLRSCMIAGYVDEAVHNLLQIDGRMEFISLLMGVGRKPWELHAGDDSMTKS